LAVLLLSSLACATDTPSPRAQKPTVSPDGTVHAPAFAIPFSSFASEQARQRLIDNVAHPLPITPGDIEKTRKDLDEQFHRPLLSALNRLFSVSISPQSIGGIQTDVVIPTDGISLENKSRALINVHGGGFQVAARLGGQIESIPIAALGKIKVVTVDYRQGPENKFPSGTEDVVKVYRELLKDYPAENIGIYGCSAGGILTSQVLAWLQAHQLPTPGGAGIFGAGALVAYSGDSTYVSAVLAGSAPRSPTSARSPTRGMEPYFGTANLQDPLVSPINSPAILAKFPPTLIISGSRDYLLSSALYTHTQLVKARVDADLHVWEGVGHCFFYHPELPESHEAWNVIVDFFDQHLGKTPRSVANNEQLESARSPTLKLRMGSDSIQ
jgi:acetyl esterase/lipase